MEFNSQIISALIGAISGFIGTIIFKPIIDRRFHLYQLEKNHQYDQRKKIKDILSKYKVHFIDSCESLNHRLWNLSENYKFEWHKVDRNFNEHKNYYFHSFIYRILLVFNWLNNIENEMIYLDTTISSKSDLIFIKFLKTMPLIFCNTNLFNGTDYNKEFATDHFFRNDFNDLSYFVSKGNETLSFSEYASKVKTNAKEIESLCHFIDDINPNENRYRWDVLQLFHILIIAFLNTFGYDFQLTPKNKIVELLNRNRSNKLYKNFILQMNNMMLSKHPEINNLIKIISKLSNTA